MPPHPQVSGRGGHVGLQVRPLRPTGVSLRLKREVAWRWLSGSSVVVDRHGVDAVFRDAQCQLPVEASEAMVVGKHDHADARR